MFGVCHDSNKALFINIFFTFLIHVILETRIVTLFLFVRETLRQMCCGKHTTTEVFRRLNE